MTDKKETKALHLRLPSLSSLTTTQHIGPPSASQEPLSPGRVTISTSPTMALFLGSDTGSSETISKRKNTQQSPETKPVPVTFTADEIEQLGKFFSFTIPVDIQKLDDNHTLSLIELKDIEQNDSQRHQLFGKRAIQQKQTSNIVENNSLSESGSASTSVLSPKKHDYGYISSDYDHITTTMTKLFMLGMQKHIHESILCVFIMRDIYSYMQLLKASTTEEANNASDILTRLQLVKLTDILYHYFIKVNCPFSLNISDKAFNSIRSRWVYIDGVNPAEIIQGVTITRIPPLEPMMQVLNGLISETGIRQSIKELNRVSSPRTISAIAARITDTEKENLKSLFAALTEVECPRKTPLLFNDLATILKIEQEAERQDSMQP